MVKRMGTRGQNMADGDASGTDGLARLEAALDRIAQAPRPRSASPAGPDAVAERLDALIGQLREALAVEA